MPKRYLIVRLYLSLYVSCSPNVGLLVSRQQLMSTRAGSMEAKQKITMTLVTALAAQEGDGSIIWDTDVTGFGVRLGKKAPVYILGYRAPGKPYARISIGRADRVTVDHARNKAKQMIGEAASGIDPQAEKRAKMKAAKAAAATGSHAFNDCGRAVSRLARSPQPFSRPYGAVSKARASIGRYFEFYNTKRPHSSLGARTPDQMYFDNLPRPVAA